jgi:hypothetical protein
MSKRPTFAVRVAKAEAIRLLGKAIRKKQADFAQDKLDYADKIKQWKITDAKQKSEYIKVVKRAKTLRDLVSLRAPYPVSEPPRPTLSLCDEKQLLVMLRADTRDVIPVPEGSLLWALIQGRCTPIT